ARDISGAHSGLKHRIPSPERLLPEGAGPGELAILHHVLIAAPDVVHEYVNAPLFLTNPAESSLNQSVVSMIADKGCTLVLDILHVFGSPTGDIDLGAGVD